MDPRIYDLGSSVGRSLVQRFLAGSPSVAEALARADAGVAVFDVRLGPDPLFVAAQRALDAAVRAVPGDSRVLFVAVVVLPDLIEAGAWDFSRRRGAFVPLTCARGVFLGYAALGEGGVMWFDDDGNPGGPRDEAVLAALARC